MKFNVKHCAILVDTQRVSYAYYYMSFNEISICDYLLNLFNHLNILKSQYVVITYSLFPADTLCHV